MLTETGYKLLKERYEADVGDDPTGFMHHIQKRYLERLKICADQNGWLNKTIDTIPEQTKNLANVLKLSGGVTGSQLVFPGITPDPLYEASLELGRFLIKQKNFVFCPTPYLYTSKNMYAMKSMCVYEVLSSNVAYCYNKEEIEKAKEHMLGRIRYGGENVYHDVYGWARENSNWSMTERYRIVLLVCSAKVPKVEL